MRTPLNAILLLFEMIARQSDRGDESALKLQIERAKRVLEGYVSRTSVLLDTARLSGDVFRLDRQPVVLEGLVSAVTDLYAAKAEYHGTRIDVDIAPGLVGRWDRAAVETILTNLVSNALKYGEGTPVVISARTRRRQRDHPCSGLRTGYTGRPTRRIFEKFNRAMPSNIECWVWAGLMDCQRICTAAWGIDHARTHKSWINLCSYATDRTGNDCRECCVRLERSSTGIRTLDQIIGGGLLKGGVYIVQGAAGTGKTILANQIAFNHVAAGGRVAYVTLLAESHARMIQHMELFSFYVESAIPRGMHYVSAYNELMERRPAWCRAGTEQRDAAAQGIADRAGWFGDCRGRVPVTAGPQIIHWPDPGDIDLGRLQHVAPQQPRFREQRGSRADHG